MRLSEAIKHYSKSEVAIALVNSAQNREVSVQLYDKGYGKRPDTLQMPGDVITQVKSGASSFHISEERWSDPLLLTQNSTKKDQDNLRTGWDLILDIDCPWGFDIATITAKLIIDALKYHDIKTIGCKFSGNKGWHIAVPMEAFPKKIGKVDIKDMYPELAKAIATYLIEFIKPHLEAEVLLLADGDIKKISERVGKDKDEFFDSQNQRFLPNFFSQIDIILASPRHLFRAPYSLHEKSGLVSLPINPDDIDKFTKDWAKIENVKTFRTFIDIENAVEGEASQLVTQALDWRNKIDKGEAVKREPNKFEFSGKTPKEIFPPCIKCILDGLEDGRKRSLFILLNFLKSLNWDWKDIENEILEWNSKNKEPLREGYIKTQLNWHNKAEKIPPPNCKQYYEGICVCKPDSLCSKVKNPLTYVMFNLKKTERGGPKST